MTVDGTDVLAVYKLPRRAVQRARRGGTNLLECMTHRWRIHSEQRGNPTDPRPRDAVEAAQQHDPITVFGAKLQAQGVATATTLAQIDGDVRASRRRWRLPKRVHYRSQRTPYRMCSLPEALTL